MEISLSGIHSAITTVMPQEVVIIVFVLVLWMVILKHFYSKYEKITFVGPRTAIFGGLMPGEETTGEG